MQKLDCNRRDHPLTGSYNPPSRCRHDWFPQRCLLVFHSSLNFSFCSGVSCSHIIFCFIHERCEPRPPLKLLNRILESTRMPSACQIVITDTCRTGTITAFHKSITIHPKKMIPKIASGANKSMRNGLLILFI
jgi:hypothetical protein